MAFDVQCQYGEEPVETRKSNNRVIVQLVEITNQNGGNAVMVLDVREVYDGQHGWTSGKNGFMFTSRDQVNDLIDRLTTAVEDVDWVEPSGDEPETNVKTKSVKRRKTSPVAARAKKKG